MKIRSEHELQEFLDGRSQIRKRELITLSLQLGSRSRPHEKALLLRAAIPMVYAHWEGFVKEASEAYLLLVAAKPRVLDDLTPCFRALACRVSILEAAGSRSVSKHADLLSFYEDHRSKSLTTACTGVVDTGSNLNFDQFCEIRATIGLGLDPRWTTQSATIDQKLLKTRNEVSHGELVPVDEMTFREVHTFVTAAIDDYKTEILNAASLKAFLK